MTPDRVERAAFEGVAWIAFVTEADDGVGVREKSRARRAKITKRGARSTTERTRGVDGEKREVGRHRRQRERTIHDEHVRMGRRKIDGCLARRSDDDGDPITRERARSFFGFVAGARVARRDYAR